MTVYKIYSRTLDKGKPIYRTEFINTTTNKMFNRTKSAKEVKMIYQSFWNSIGRGPKVIVDKAVKVQSKVRKQNWGIKLLR